MRRAGETDAKVQDNLPVLNMRSSDDKVTPGI